MPTKRASILLRMQEVMGPLPTKPQAPPSVRLLLREEFSSYERFKISYEAERGDFVPAWLLVPKQASRCPAALCLHQTQRYGKDEPAGIGTRYTLHYAKELAQRGFVTLAPDYPNFGEYLLDVYQKGYQSASMKGIVNHRRGIDLLLSHPKVRTDAVGAIGHSLGGHNALFLAAFDERVRSTVTSCGFTSFSRYFGGDLAGWSHKGYMPRIAAVYAKDPHRMPFDFPDVLSAIAPRNLFINAPQYDSNFDLKGVKDCVAAASPHFAGKARIVARYPNAGHDFPDEVRMEAYDFLEQTLSSTPH